mmetsp:Transcript_40736/g.75721  ORF Transcript_40736/g.75721 Transcript_40736/m.75721 type:complete len:212 (+) Transcript_40736:46-681(+)
MVLQSLRAELHGSPIDLHGSSQPRTRSRSVPLFCSCGLEFQEDSWEMALAKTGVEVALAALARSPCSDFSISYLHPDRARISVTPPQDADVQLLEAAILRNAAEAEAIARKQSMQSCDNDLGLCKRDQSDTRARLRAARAMLRGSWKPRFVIGEAVECFCDNGWCQGRVVKHRYREPEWGKGRVAAYQCRLDTGTLIYVPIDHDSMVRAMR